MAEDLNQVMLVGRLTRDAELVYTTSGYPVAKFSIAVNRRRKSGDAWIDEGNFFDVNLWGKRGESLERYLRKGQQIGVLGQLRQDRWEQDGMKRSKVLVEAVNIQLLGGRSDESGASRSDSGYGSPPPSKNFAESDSAPPPSGYVRNFDDDIPF